MTEATGETGETDVTAAKEGTEETETETIAGNLTAKENAGEVDHLVTIGPDEITMIHIPQVVHTEIANDKNATATVAMTPNGIGIEVQEEEMVTDLHDGISSMIAEAVEVDIETEIRIVVSKRTEMNSLRRQE